MIYGYFGKPGAGKTLFAVQKSYRLSTHWVIGADRALSGHWTLGHREQRRPLYSNIPLKIPGVEVQLVKRVRDLVAIRSGVILLDEVGLEFNAKEWKLLPKDVFRLFTQYRKLGLDLVYTAQRTGQVNVDLRSVTSAFYKVRRVGSLVWMAEYESDDFEVKPLRKLITGMNRRYFKWYDTLGTVKGLQ